MDAPGRSFVAWVAPTAAVLAADRRALIDFAVAAPPRFWGERSAIDGWTHKDILAHLAGGNDMLVQTLLRSLTLGEPLPPAPLAPDTDAENARRVAERRDWPVPRLIAELERDGDDVLDWLSRLTEAHAGLRPDGLGMTVRRFFDAVRSERHDALHLAHLRRGLP